ncbi:MAG: hypothetical protein A2X55_08875 [Nitrospirae bacterium GWB2_47_37]|nr:MAG: hypothetical protein A2X55_08875 [Nitrospirae bacterium GWB2_47_37]HAK87624.1 hypothetical protein [Nitrospiraceae bacterium]
MYKAAVLLCLSVFLLSGCASFFAVGEQDFACKGNELDGKCGDPITIYKNREKILKDSNKAKAEKDIAEDKIDKKDKKTSIDIVKASPERTRHVPVPVMETPKAAKIYIDSFPDTKGNYITGHHIFIVVEEWQWLLPDGRVLE